MESARERQDEAQVLRALRLLTILDTPAEPEFDALVRVASLACGTPISLLSLVDQDRQWFKANCGLPSVAQTSREEAFCAHAVLGPDLFEVPDTWQDPRFADNPLVTGNTDIRFYAGAPLRLSGGELIGTLCVMDHHPRTLSHAQRTILQNLSLAAVQAMEGRRAIGRVLAATQEAAVAARLLAASEHNLRLVVDTLPSMTAYLNPDLTCRFANAATRTWFGVNPASLPGTHIRDLLQPTLYALDKPLLEAALGGDAQKFQRVVVCPDGVTRHAAVHFVPDRRDGDVQGLLVQVADVTELSSMQSSLHKAHDLLERAGRIAGVGGWDIDLATNRVQWSAQSCRIHGDDPGYLPSLDDVIAACSAECAGQLRTALANARTSGASFDLELNITRLDGERRWVRMIGSVETAAGAPRRLVGALQDITERRALTAALADQHELLRVTLQSIVDAVITTDARGVVTWLNPAAERMTDWFLEDAVGCQSEQVFQLLDEGTRTARGNPVIAVLQRERAAGAPTPTLLVSRHGQELGVEYSVSPIRDREGLLLGTVVVFRDVSTQRQMAREMSYRANHDELTGLVNRAAFERRLGTLLQRAREDHTEHAMLYLDLDQFKLVNDACGHASGDELLKQVSRLFSKAVRARDTLARLGGDEFGILLEHCTVRQAEDISAKICELMDDYRFAHEERRFRVGTSIGLVPVDARWTDTAAIHQAADASCYAAKEAGRNRTHVWHDTDRAIRSRRAEGQWAARIENALDDDRLVLFAQRIVPLTHPDAGLHAEVLVRMQNPDGSISLAGAFLPAAERFNLVTRLDRRVLRKVLAWLGEPQHQLAVTTLNVNLSGQSVGDPAFRGWVQAVLAEAGPQVRAHLCLEITETVAITNLAEAAQFVRDLRRVGVQVALDDFGAGASSFGYLKSLPVDYLKIDGQFVRDLVTDTLDDAAVRCFTDVARLVGVATVAEFVETPAVLARLKEIGVNFAQGYLLHRPEPIGHLLDLPAIAAG